jgi:hypothetical protein
MIGNQTHNLPACSVVAQSTTLFITLTKFTKIMNSGMLVKGSCKAKHKKEFGTALWLKA